MQSNTLLCLNQFGPRKSSLTPFFLKQLTYFLKSFLDAYIVGRKVSILKNDAQSCLCNMLKSDIPATFWHIAFENQFNGTQGLHENSILDFTQKIHKFSITTTLLWDL